MLSSQKLWLALFISGLCATLTLAIGFGFAVRSVTHPITGELNLPGEQGTSSPDDEANKEGFTIVTIGDSLTRGMGDHTGNGYPGLVKNALAETSDEPVYLIPFAVDGYRSDELRKDLSTESGLVTAIQQADLILMSSGANDFIQLGEAIDPETVLELMPDVLDDIAAIMERLVELNSSAQIVYVGLYDPFSSLDSSGQVAMLIQEFNQAVFQLTLKRSQVTVVPIFDLFYRTSEQFLSADLFHPNEEGYARIAVRVLQAIEANDGGDQT